MADLPHQSSQPAVFSVAATFTAQPLGESLRFWGEKLGMALDVRWAETNQVFQELQNADSLMSANSNGAGIILLRFEDWRKAASGDGVFNERKNARELADSLKTAAARSRAPLFVVFTPPSPGHEQEHDELVGFVLNLAADAPGVIFIKSEEVLDLYPVAEILDPECDALGGIPYTDAFFAALGTCLVRRMHQMTRRPFRVVAFNADNTLWQGFAAESQPSEITVDEPRRFLQECLVQLKEAGFRLALVSRNLQSDLEAVFDRHPEMPLKPADIASWHTSWAPKSSSLRELARELDLPLESLIYLDEDPVEVAAIQSELPNLATWLLPQDFSTLPDFLQHVWAFDSSAITEDDRLRLANFRTSAPVLLPASRAAFHLALGLEAAIEPPSREDFRRLSQLTRQVDIFTTSGLHRSEVEVTHILGTGAVQGLKVTVRDRFSDAGLAGFLAFYKEGTAIMVENFLLSARALGRGVEHRMLAALGTAAERLRCTEVHIPWLPGERNQPALDFLRSVAGDFARDLPGGPGQVFMIPSAVAQACRLEMTEPAPPRTPPGSTPLPTTVWNDIAHSLATAPQILAAIDAARHRSRPALATEFTPPKNQLESRLAELWSAVLAVSPVGTRDDFTALGGTPVLATRLLSRIASELKIQLPQRAVADHPTIADLALAAARAEKRAARPRLQPIDRAPGQRHPLSSAQRHLWHLDRLSPGASPFNITAARRMIGRLNMPAFRNSIDALSARQEILRATFPEIDGEPAQVFTESGIRLLFTDLSDLDPHQRLDTAIARAMDAAAAPFNLATGPLTRAHLFRLEPDDHVLVLNFHHIIADEASMLLFFRELSALYEGFAGRSIVTLDPLPVQHLDCAAWQDACFQSGAFAEDLAYWRDRLKDAPGFLHLPTDFPRPATPSFRTATVSRRLPAHFSAALQNLAARENVTLSLLLTTAWQVLLHRWSGQDDILLCIPASGRTEPEIEPLIGPLLNTLLLRITFSPALTFREALHQVRDTAAAALAHQELPFETLVDALGLSLQAGIQPHCQVLFLLRSASTGDFTAPGLQSLTIPLDHLTCPCDLLLEAVPAPEGLLFNLKYNTSLFRQDTASRLLGCLSTLLYSISQASDSRIADYSLLNEEETRQIIYDWNPFTPSQPPAPTLPQWFEVAAREWPGHAAVSFAGSSLTYRQLNARASQIARALMERGVRRDIRVALALEPGPDLIAGLLGILKAGGCVVPLDPTHPPARLAAILDDTSALVLLTQSSLLPRLPRQEAGPLLIDEEPHRLSNFDTSPPASSAAADSIAVIQYTSGSTGQPKGCPLTHQNLARLFSTCHSSFKFSAGDVWSLSHSIAFDFSFWEIFGALLFGGRLAIPSDADLASPTARLQFLASEQVTFLNQTPCAFRELIAAESALASPPALALRTVVLGGEPLAPAMLKPWFERHGEESPRLYNMYGLTEAAIHSTWRPLAASDTDGGSVIGVPLPDVRLYILDRNLKPCPVGVPGDIFVGGPGVAQSYWNRRELTAQRFFPSPFVPGDTLYFSGDRARFLPGRDIEFLGRSDRQLKICGFRVEPAEVEGSLSRHPAVLHCVVAARPSPGGPFLAAWLVTRPGLQPTTDVLRQHLLATLPEPMVPTAWVFLDKLPRTLNGKLDESALPRPNQETAPAASAFAPPRTAAEASLCEIFAGVLQLDRVGIHDHFFSFSGNDPALLAEAVAQCQLSGLDLTSAHLAAHPTPAQLASALFPDSPALKKDDPAPAQEPAEEPAGPEPSPLPTLEGDVPLTPPQRWFLDQELHGQDYWNQAMVFAVNHDLDPEKLELALGAVLDHHDAFRLRLARAPEGGWRQFYSTRRPDTCLEVVDGIALQVASDRAQQSLDLVRGPLIKAVYSRSNPLRSARLFIAVHHLAMDDDSWRLLLEDIETAYRGQPLPRRTATFQAWGRALQQHVRHCRDELPYWEDVCSRIEPNLPPDSPEPGPNTEDSAESLRVSLSATDTLGLLQRVPAAWRCRVEDVLLAALAMAFRRLTKKRALCVDLQEPARDDLIPSLDCSRTIGWFTAHFPARLELPEGMSSQDALKSVKEQLRQLPRRGLGFGLLRHLGGNESHALRHAPAPDLSFHFLGQLDNLVAGSLLFSLAPETTSAWHHPRARRAHAIDVLAATRSGVFTAEFRYSKSVHRPETAAEISRVFIAALQQIIAICGSPGAGGYTPSDFPLAGLSQQMVDTLTTGRTDVEDILPLSPLQSSLLTLAPFHPTRGLQQWSCRLKGPLNTDAFRQAWSLALNRHPLLRSAILTAGLAQPLQIILHRVTPQWKSDDLRWLPRQDRERALAEILSRDAAMRPDPTRPPLSRFTVVQLEDDEFFLLWSVPDFQLDAVSWALVQRDAAHAYQAICSREAPALPPPADLADTLAHLLDLDPAADRPFFARHLQGFQQPTPLPIDRAEAQPAGGLYEVTLTLPQDEWDSLSSFAGEKSVPPAALLMAAWAILLSKSAADDDIVFGAGLDGRPDSLPGARDLAGPFATHLPLRLAVDPDTSLSSLVTTVGDQLRALSSRQSGPVSAADDASALPWHTRLFDSVVIFQDTHGAPEFRRFGEKVTLTRFQSPHPFTWPLALIASPGAGLDVTLVCQANRCTAERASLLVHDVLALLGGMVLLPRNSTIGQVASLATITPGCAVRRPPALLTRPLPTAPRTELEATLLPLWQQAFGQTTGTTDDFLRLGGTPFLARRLAGKIRDLTSREVTPADLLNFPTIAAIATWLTASKPR